MGARHICAVREHNTSQPVLNNNIKRAQGVCPWSPSQEGARDQGSVACRGTPSRGEARTIHHQPVPVLTLTMTTRVPCPTSLLAVFGSLKKEKKKISNLKKNLKISYHSHKVFGTIHGQRTPIRGVRFRLALADAVRHSPPKTPSPHPRKLSPTFANLKKISYEPHRNFRQAQTGKNLLRKW